MDHKKEARNKARPVTISHPALTHPVTLSSIKYTAAWLGTDFIERLHPELVGTPAVFMHEQVLRFLLTYQTTIESGPYAGLRVVDGRDVFKSATHHSLSDSASHKLISPDSHIVISSSSHSTFPKGASRVESTVESRVESTVESRVESTEPESLQPISAALFSDPSIQDDYRKIFD